MNFKQYLAEDIKSANKLFTESTMEMDWEFESGKISRDSLDLIKSYNLTGKKLDKHTIEFTGKLKDLKKFAKEVGGDPDGFPIEESNKIIIINA